MADTEYDQFLADEAQDEGGQKSGGKKKALFSVLLLLVLGGGGAGVYFSGILDEFKKTVVKSEHPAAPPPPAQSVYFDLPDMLVNLNTEASKPHFLKFRASLELESSIDVNVLQPLEPRIIDKFQVYVRELRLDDLRVSGGLKLLREELLVQINDITKPVKVRNVLFRNLLVQ